MEPIQALVLGIIQGLTEFLPVSSSGHLVLFQQLFGLKEAELFFDVSVHMGTLTAVIIFFRREIRNILVSLAGGIRDLIAGTPFSEVIRDKDVKLALLIIAGSVPTAIIGLLLKQVAEQIFSSVFLVGCALMVNGGVLWATRLVHMPGKGIEGFSVGKALLIGIAQGLAITPGISRSGSTITCALFLKLEREIAARYSFLLSIPAIVGAQILTLKDLGSAARLDETVVIGTLASAVVGYGALAMLVYIVKRGRIHLFAPYCWLVGLVTLASGWI